MDLFLYIPLCIAAIGIIYLLFVLFKQLKQCKECKKQNNEKAKIIAYFLEQFRNTPLKKTATVTSGFSEIIPIHGYGTYQPRHVAITSTIDNMEVTVSLWHMNPKDAEMKLPKLLQLAAELYSADEIELSIYFYVKDTNLEGNLYSTFFARWYLDILTKKVLNKSFNDLIRKEVIKNKEENARLKANSELFLKKVNGDYDQD